jgi:hypothetical protein
MTTGKQFEKNISSNEEVFVITIDPAKNSSHVRWQSNPLPRGDITN